MILDCHDSVLTDSIVRVMGEEPVSYYSSGTTGAPKSFAISWASLHCSARGSASDIVVLGYPIRSFAGLSVIAYAKRHQCTLRAAPLATLASCLRGASHLCTTPTLVRLLLMRAADFSTLTNIVLGGEAARQPLLNDLRQHTAAVITQTYASSEQGLHTAWSDGIEGCPLSKWTTADSSDLWELRDGRMYFEGRTHDLVNVAGETVNLNAVERELLTVRGITHVQITARPSSLIGHVLEAECVGAYAADDMKDCLRRMPNTMRPRLVRRMAEPRIAQSGKQTR